MAKKNLIENSELQKLTPFPNNVDDVLTYSVASKEKIFTAPVASQERNVSGVCTSNEKKNGDKNQSGPPVANRMPSFRLSTPNSQGYSRVNYLNEKKYDSKKGERSSLVTPPQKKDASDVQQIEKKLLQLMEDFETGKLKAFGKDSRLRQMEEIREQQERLARLHFDVGAEEDLYPPLSEDGLRISEENMKTLMEKLAQLSESIENLHTNTHADRKPEGKHPLFGDHIYHHAIPTPPLQQNTHNDAARQSATLNSPSTTPHYHNKPSFSTPQNSKTKEHHQLPISGNISSDSSHIAGGHKTNTAPGTSTANTVFENINTGFQIKFMNNPNIDFPGNTKLKQKLVS